LHSDNRKVQRFVLAVSSLIDSHTGSSEVLNPELLSRDVSSGGAYFVTQNPLDVGTRLVVNLELKPQYMKGFEDRKACITIGGVVLRRETNGMAVQFDKSYKIKSIKA